MGKPVDIGELEQKIPLIGADFDSINGDEFNVEFFPDRPDLFSVEGIARAMRAFLGFKTGLCQYNIKPSGAVLNVERGVEHVRPYIVSGIIKNVEMSDVLTRSLMNMQEKLHMTLGRGRSKVAIGVHDMKDIIPPYTYKAVKPNSVRFQPLGMENIMDLDEILKEHPKGVDYAHILEGKPLYPFLVDAQDNVLSFPPIINGTLTMVNDDTRDIFLDLTGTDLKALKQTLNIIMTAFGERGADLYSVDVHYPDYNIITPDLDPKETELDPGYVSRFMGFDTSPEQIKELLERMGFGAEVDGSKLLVKLPAYRADILHSIDLVEDVAIAYGYGNFQPEFPRKMTFGKRLQDQELQFKLRRIIMGMGFNEIMTLTLSSEKEQFEDMNMPIGQCTLIENPSTEDHTCMRTWLLPSLMKIFSVNKHRETPQKIFEIGDVVLEHENVSKICMASLHSKASFTSQKSELESFLKVCGVEDYKLEAESHPTFMSGRCASVHIAGEDMGFFGEVHPQVLENYGLENPLTACELFTSKLF